MHTNRKHIPEEVLSLLIERDTSGLKSSLDALQRETKGDVFEHFLAELYRGNGWLVQRKGGRGDAGADILLYHPKTPSTVSLIVQAKNHSLPLTFDQVRIELIKFEEQSSPLHNCQNFRLVAVNGFVKEAEKLAEFNLLLDSWEHIEDLISKYNTESNTEPAIELFAHNRNTYNRINELWEESRHVAVVQATGTGKSYLIAKVLADHIDKRKIVLAPSNYILDQQQSKMPWLSSSTDYLTYAKLSRMTAKEIKSGNYGLIVLDEFHRCGADIWGKGVQGLLDSHPEAKVLGTTATPIRYLDDSRDMAEELFDGIIAEDLSLAEAIVRRILPPPTYISALYTLNEECASLLEEVEVSKRTEEEKTGLRQEINSVRLDWEKTSGVPEILKKHLPDSTNKLIVFCKDQQHLDEMELEVQRWFLKAGIHKRRKTYRILSADPNSDKNLEEFKKANSKDTVHLLFAIDMLNEGLHIQEVGAVILLRPTESPIIFYQQIGRCIQVGKEHTPIIFDLVNNFQNVRANDFLCDIKEAKDREQFRRAELSLADVSPSIKIEEFTRPIEELFEAIRERLEPWDVMFEVLGQYALEVGNCMVPAIFKSLSGHSLGRWVSKQRYNKNNLPQERISRLEALPGWSWDVLTDQWEEGYGYLIEYSQLNGNCRVPAKYRTFDGYRLGGWVWNQRRLKRLGELSESRIKLLEALPGWTWDPLTEQWELGFNYLEDYVQREGHSRVQYYFKTTEGFPLGSWVITKRSRKNKLTTEQIKRLESLPGWSWDAHSDQWEEWFRSLEEYALKEGHCRVPAKLKGWASKQRVNKDKLYQEQIKRLESLPGWSWDPYSDQWEEGFRSLEEHALKEGHCRVPASYKLSNDCPLVSWISTQRTNKKMSTLSQERISRLEALPGWSWDVLTDQWEEGYGYLIEYSQLNGNCRVPQRFKLANGYQLGTWVSNNRIRASKLSKVQIKRLESLPGWSWDAHSDQWEEGFRNLEEYGKKEGNTLVPAKYKTSCGYTLGRWVNKQRTSKNRLSADKVTRLEALPGWSWDVLSDQWAKGYDYVKAYSQLYEHCRIPKEYMTLDGYLLGRWASYQRKMKDKMPSEKRILLEAVPGWVW